MRKLNKQEEDFIQYWGEQRKKKKQYFRKLSIGLPLGMVIVVALCINFMSGWYQKADMELHRYASVFIVIFVAIVAIVVFIAVFSVRHKWDLNETYYQELLYKKDQPV